MPDIILHSIFQEGSDLEEIASCVTAFLDGDCGTITSDDEVLGFMKRSVEGKARHGIYETKTGGRVHVIGDDEKVMAMPDIIFAQSGAGSLCSMNTCQHNHETSNE
jgi:hypothetical protein